LIVFVKNKNKLNADTINIKWNLVKLHNYCRYFSKENFFFKYKLNFFFKLSKKRKYFLRNINPSLINLNTASRIHSHVDYISQLRKTALGGGFRNINNINLNNLYPNIINLSPNNYLILILNPNLIPNIKFFMAKFLTYVNKFNFINSSIISWIDEVKYDIMKE
jgi:hypothetical protein